MSCLGLRLSICVLGITMPLLLAGSADAAAVQCGAGDVQCLIAAINAANARPQRKTIIQLAGGTYSLSDVDNLIDGPNGLPSIASTITIEAGPAGATITRDDNALPFRLLHVEPAGHLSLNGVSLVNGDSQIDTSTMSPLRGRGGALLNDRGSVTIVNCGFESNQAEDGGGVFTNLGTLKVSDTTFVNNTGMDTGGLVNAGGIVTLTRSQFNGNRGDHAGAISTKAGEMRISESRFVGNAASIDVGGLLVVGGTVSIANATFSNNGALSAGALRIIAGSVTVRDSTFVEKFVSLETFYNSGTADVINTTFTRTTNFRFQGGGVLIANFGQLTLRSSTVVTNEAVGVFEGGSNILTGSNATTLLQNSIVIHTAADSSIFDCAGTGYVSLGNNIIGEPATCHMALESTDLVGDANLDVLADDGTPGNAHFAPLRGSQVIGAANAAACIKKDQIGQRRLQNCDIGAVEFRRTSQ